MSNARVNGIGDGDVLCGMVVKCMGMGWGWKRNHGDGVGIGLIFNTVSLVSLYLDCHHCSTAFVIHLVDGAVVTVADFSLVNEIVSCEVVNLCVSAQHFDCFSRLKNHYR